MKGIIIGVFLFFIAIFNSFTQEYKLGEKLDIDESLLERTSYDWYLSGESKFLNYTWEINIRAKFDKIIYECRYEIIHDNEQQQKSFSAEITPIIFSYAQLNGYTLQKKIVWIGEDTILFMNPNNGMGIYFRSGLDGFFKSVGKLRFHTAITFSRDVRKQWSNE